MKIYNKKDYPILILLTIMNMIFVGLQLFLAILNKYLIDDIIQSKSSNMLKIWLVIAVVSYIISHLMNVYGINYFKFKYFLNKIKELTNKTLITCLKEPVYKYKNMNDGYLMNVLVSDIGTIMEISVQKIVEYTTLIIGIFISLIFLFKTSILSFIIIIISIPIYIISTNIFNPKLVRHEANQKKVHDNTMLQLQNILINKKSIKLAKKEKYFTNFFYESYSDWIKYRLRFWKLQFLATETPKIVSSIVTVIIFYVLTINIFNEKGTIGELIFVQAIMANMFEFINRILDIYIRSKVVEVSKRRIDELYTTTKEILIKEEIDRGLKLSNIDISIDDKFLYHIDNMDIKDNGIYIIEGDNGVGKSMLFNILMSISSPITKTSDSIIKISDDMLNASYLSSPYIFINDTVKNNILLGEEENLMYNELIKLLDINIESKIVEIGGKNLSYGEQQKIALARILYENKNVMILDEPYVNLDSQTKIRVSEYLDNIRNEKMIFIISHDKETRMIANNIYRIHNKSIQEVAYS